MYLQFCGEFKKFHKIVEYWENDNKNYQRSSLPPLNSRSNNKRFNEKECHLIISPESCESFHSDGHNSVNRSWRQNHINLHTLLEERKQISFFVILSVCLCLLRFTCQAHVCKRKDEGYREHKKLGLEW